MISDLRFALRMLAKAPGQTAAIVLILALATGATTAIFSVVYGVVLRPLPYPEPDRMIVVRETQLPQFPEFSLSPPNFLDFQKAACFEAFAAVRGQNFILTGNGEPQRLPGAAVTADYFRVYGTPALLGRWLLPEEDAPGKDHAVVITYGFWQRQFGGAADVLNRTITLNGRPRTIVGVMPPEWRRDSRGEIYAPMAFRPDELTKDNRGSHYLGAVGRLKSGVTRGQAEAELKLIAAQLAAQYPDSNKGWSVMTKDFLADTVGDARGVLFTLLGAVACVLLIACANIANLLLARSTGRAREFAVRAALGAPRGRLLRQLLTESVALSVLGGAAGIALAYASLKGLVALAPAGLPRLSEIRLDGAVLSFSLALSVATGLIFGLLPAWQASRLSLVETLKDGARGSGHRRTWLRHALVVVEVALSLVLVAAAALLVRSFGQLRAVDHGYDPANVTIVNVPLTGLQQASNDPAPVVNFAQQVIERFRALPGVTHVGVNHSMPLMNDWILGFEIEGLPAATEGDMPSCGYYSVTPDYFAAMGIRLLGGRVFTERDDAKAVPVAVISEKMARQYFPGENPIGKRIWVTNGPKMFREIVGVVADVKHYGVDREAQPQVYDCYLQKPYNSPTFVIRSAGEPQPAMLQALRPAVFAVKADQPVSTVRPLVALVADSISRQRYSTLLLGLFAGVALLIAAVGIYGVMTYTVTQRTTEIGVRMALGAQQGDVLGLILRQGMGVVIVGVVVGLGGALAAGHLVAAQLYRVSPRDPATLALAAAVLLAAALTACLLPARRATRVDPLIALRND